MASKIMIWNMALGFIGTRTVTSEAEKCQEAVQCNLFWDNARRSVLRAYPFQFAQRKQSLAEKILPKEYGSMWRHAYGLPYNCLAVQAVADTNNFYEKKYFETAVTSEGERVLLCDVSPCFLHFTEDVDNTDLFDELFINALAYKLAALVCVPLLKNNAQKVQELNQLYEMSIQKAVQSNAREQKQKPYMDEWISSRY